MSNKKSGVKNMQDWLEWQKRIIREEYVEGKRDEKNMGQSEIRKRRGRGRTSSR
jgi:hypothetical protein